MAKDIYICYLVCWCAFFLFLKVHFRYKNKRYFVVNSLLNRPLEVWKIDLPTGLEGEGMVSVTPHLQ